MMNDVLVDIESKVVAITSDFLKELESPWAYRTITVDLSLEQDLGIDSLKKAELIHRIEGCFDVRLPDTLVSEVNQLKDIAMAVQEAGPLRLIEQREFTPILEEAHFNPSSAGTLIDVLMGYGKKEPNRPHIYLQDEDAVEQIISYGQLLEVAKKVAHGLREHGFEKGETAAIMLPTSVDFFYAFFGILFAGGIPVPIYPPFRPDQIEEYVKREVVILRNAGVRVLITFHKAKTLSKLLQPFVPSLMAVTTVDALIQPRGGKLHLSFEGDDSALIQYTSGSTGDPKGVLLSHNNLLANIRAYGEATQVKSTDSVVSWLPLYHDMGLIGAWLGALYHGIPITILSPITFLTRPERWLWSIHYHRATLSAAPNFAYELCTHKIKDEAIEGLNLSSWRLALNGAEAIYPKTIREFTKRFSAYGFRAETLFPAYGLAESSVALAFPPFGREPVFDKIDREAFDKKGLAEPVAPDAKRYHEFVSCGAALPGHEIRIVDNNNQVLDERKIGCLQFRGPSAMQGYYRNQTATEAVYHDGWWDTGDLAYQANGELFITGRKKDIVIKAGRNFYPEEIEEIVSQTIGIRKGCVIAFGTSDPERGTEKLIVIAEVHEPTSHTKHEIRDDIIKKVAIQLGIPPDEVILMPARSIPKTSSGKLRRSACKKDYLQGKLVRHKMPSWFQVAKLFFRSTLKRIRSWPVFLLRLIYTVYLAVVLIIVVSFSWILVLIFPKKIRAKTSKMGARLIVWLSGCPVTIRGRENLDKDWPLIIVANHASYIDSLLLMAYLPTSCAIVGKKEVLDYPIIRTFMKRLNYLTVDRMDFLKSLSDVENIISALRDGRSVVIFSEGILSAEPGLRPFKSGAFKIAVEANFAICPLAIQGTRSILRDNHFILKPASLTITIGVPIQPEGSGWSEIGRLSRLNRAEIAKHCGEQVIKI